jgi:hypothetical protein
MNSKTLAMLLNNEDQKEMFKRIKEIISSIVELGIKKSVITNKNKTGLIDVMIENMVSEGIDPYHFFIGNDFLRVLVENHVDRELISNSEKSGLIDRIAKAIGYDPDNALGVMSEFETLFEASIEAGVPLQTILNGKNGIVDLYLKIGSENNLF